MTLFAVAQSGHLYRATVGHFYPAPIALNAGAEDTLSPAAIAVRHIKER